MSRSTALVDADWVQAHLTDSGVVLIEVDEDTTAYGRGHIQGAVKLHWKKDLLDPVKRDFVDRAGFEALAAGWLINCTGPAADITTTTDPLLRHLLASGLARPDPLRLGLDADTNGAVRDADGRPASDIFTLGPLLRGRWYETTAIPEIRDQAAALARHLFTGQANAAPGVAA